MLTDFLKVYYIIINVLHGPQSTKRIISLVLLKKNFLDSKDFDLENIVISTISSVDVSQRKKTAGTKIKTMKAAKVLREEVNYW